MNERRLSMIPSSACMSCMTIPAVHGVLAHVDSCGHGDPWRCYNCELSRLEAAFRPRGAVPTTRWPRNPASVVVLWEYVSRGSHTFNKGSGRRGRRFLVATSCCRAARRRDRASKRQATRNLPKALFAAPRTDSVYALLVRPAL